MVAKWWIAKGWIFPSLVLLVVVVDLVRGVSVTNEATPSRLLLWIPKIFSGLHVVELDLSYWCYSIQ